MKIDIHADSSIQDLKRQFHEQFPYLKLEFFIPGDTAGSGSRTRMLDNNQKISDVLGKALEGTAEYTATTSVGTFESLFATQFGLNVQVFRKSGNIYLETSSTDDWSLAQQNAEGKASGEETESEGNTDMTDRDQAE